MYWFDIKDIIYLHNSLSILMQPIKARLKMVNVLSPLAIYAFTCILGYKRHDIAEVVSSDKLEFIVFDRYFAKVDECKIAVHGEEYSIRRVFSHSSNCILVDLFAKRLLSGM